MGKFGDSIEVWGITGGIASGKSTAARIFQELGISVLDADLLVRELSQPGGAAHAKIVERFGTADRARIREMVFSCPKARQDLEAILHPLVREESARRIAELATQDARVVLYEAALLVETGRYRDLDGLLVIESPSELRRARLIARDRCSPEQADQIIAAQISDDRRREAASVVIENSGSLEELRQRVGEFTAKRGWTR